MLTIDQATYDAIVAHAKRDHPDEACGIVAGPEPRRAVLLPRRIHDRQKNSPPGFRTRHDPFSMDRGGS